MTAVWWAVVAGSLACLAFKVAGYLVPPRLFEPPPVRRTTDLLPVALLAGLVVVQTFGAGQALVLDARMPALAVAALLLAVRAPFLVVVVAAAATAALIRLWT